MALQRLLFIGFVFLCAIASGQDERFGKIGQHSIEVDYHFGRILKHNKKFRPTPTEFTHGWEISWNYQTFGRKDWQRKLHCPELGASFMMFRHGDNRYFGNAYMLFGNAKFWIVRSRFIDFYVKGGMGVAFVPRHFNLIENPENVNIGSTFNAAAQVKLGIDIKPLPNLQLSLGVSFTHYSNSAVQFPNLGINTPSVFIGVRYFPIANNKYKYNRDKWPKPKKKNEGMVKFSLGLQEVRPYKGPKFPVYILSGHYARYTSIVNKVMAGASLEFAQAPYDFAGFYGNPYKYNRVASAINFSLYAGDEVLLGNVGLFFIAGGYVFNPRNDVPVYVKLGLNYYFVAVGKQKNTRFFVGGNLRSHFLVAQMYEFSAGVTF